MAVKRRHHSTVSKVHPPTSSHPPLPASHRRPGPPPRAKIARLIDDRESSLLNKGVALNADIILALANVDLVYVRLSALLCAADRIFPRARK